MAPTDFQATHPNARGTALSVLLPLCDGDVNRLSGIGFYDRSVAAGKDTARNFKSVLAVWGTNHNGYNTQWQTDDTYQASSHTCPGQNKLFPHPLGLSSKQQSIGRYFLMGLVRATSQNPDFEELFNPAFTLPSQLASITRIDRSFFVGTSAAVSRILRFDGTCSSKFSVTNGVDGRCFMPAEHDASTWIGRVRWNATGQSFNAAIFTLNNGSPVNLAAFKTLDLRVGPDCFLVVSTNFTGCTGVSPTGGTSGSQNVLIYLLDSSSHFSRGLNLSSFVARAPAVGVSVPPNSGGAFLPNNPLYHAILSSARIPLSAFQASGFNLGSVRAIYVSLGDGSSRGGLYFGDASAVGVPPGALKIGEDPELLADSVDQDFAPIIKVAGTYPQPPQGVQLWPATPGGPDAVFSAAAPVETTPMAADRGARIVSVRRGRLPIAVGPSLDSLPDTTPMGTAPTVEFLLSTPEPLADTSGAGLSLVIGGHQVPARYFATGLEAASPSLAKLVVPATAVDAAADGASLAVVSATQTWRFGALSKGSIR
jgi:hypothetical protein